MATKLCPVALSAALMLVIGCAAPVPTSLGEYLRAAAFLQSQAPLLLGDRIIEPGERIGRIRLGGKLDEVTAIIGKGVERGPGKLWPSSTLYTWDSIGLWLIADNETGVLLWISVEWIVGSSSWTGLHTREGLGLGSTEEDVLSTMGAPSRTFADAYGKSIYYDNKGIRFTFLATAPLAGQVAVIRVVRPGAP